MLIYMHRQAIQLILSMSFALLMRLLLQRHLRHQLSELVVHGWVAHGSISKITPLSLDVLEIQVLKELQDQQAPLEHMVIKALKVHMAQVVTVVMVLILPPAALLVLVTAAAAVQELLEEQEIKVAQEQQVGLEEQAQLEALAVFRFKQIQLHLPLLS
jgi:hypothetical protein